LRRNSAHGIYRRPDSLSTSSQREPRNQWITDIFSVYYVHAMCMF
jgi:hypothetical protein